MAIRSFWHAFLRQNEQKAMPKAGLFLSYTPDFGCKILIRGYSYSSPFGLALGWELEGCYPG